jgi:hypothetical protein
MMGNSDDSYTATLMRHHTTNRHPGWLGVDDVDVARGEAGWEGEGFERIRWCIA